MQMIFNPGPAQGPNKSDGLDDTSIAPSPWANLLSVGLKILSAFLGGGAAAPSDGIDKVDNGSPMQVCWKFFLGVNASAFGFSFFKTVYKKIALVDAWLHRAFWRPLSPRWLDLGTLVRST